MRNDSVHCQLKSGKLAIAIPSYAQIAFSMAGNFTATITASSMSDASTAPAVIMLSYTCDLSIKDITSFKKSGDG